MPASINPIPATAPLAGGLGDAVEDFIRNFYNECRVD